MKALRAERVEFTLVTLKVSSGVGAAVLGARKAGVTLPIDYTANTDVLFHYKPDWPLTFLISEFVIELIMGSFPSPKPFFQCHKYQYNKWGIVLEVVVKS